MSTFTRDDFLAYIKAFNAQDYTTQHSFYHPDVTLFIPDVGTLAGSKSIQEHYRDIHASAEETIVPILLMIQGPKIFFQMTTYFTYKHDTNNAVHNLRVRRGDVVRVNIWALYDVVDGKLKTIVCNLLNVEVLGKVNVKKFVNPPRSLL
ncbi:MAG: hypothetical protein M1834_003966 [Cirrosporium novae-zelandiae]|nr:MAG: hypothetical protein M1834_003966 [Cirrosporium novae-zelandiae]